MKLIRNNIFETNSSSTHSLVILSKDNYEKLQNGEIAIDITDKVMDPVVELDPNKQITISKETGEPIYKGKTYEDIRELMDENSDDFDDEYATNDYLEKYAEVIKTELDDKVVMSIYREDRW